jgi:hypothetical protein
MRPESTYALALLASLAVREVHVPTRTARQASRATALQNFVFYPLDQPAFEIRNANIIA